MARNQEESWVENGLIDNLRIRWIIRDSGKKDNVFVAQLEYTNKPRKKNVVLRWDGAHKHYHMDIHDSKGHFIEKVTRRSFLPSIFDQVNIVFEDLEKNLTVILGKNYHRTLLTDISRESELFTNRLTEVKINIANRLSSKLKLGTRHWGQHLKSRARLTDSVKIESRDSEGNLKERREQ